MGQASRRKKNRRYLPNGAAINLDGDFNARLFEGNTNPQLLALFDELLKVGFNAAKEGYIRHGERGVVFMDDEIGIVYLPIDLWKKHFYHHNRTTPRNSSLLQAIAQNEASSCFTEIQEYVRTYNPDSEWIHFSVDDLGPSVRLFKSSLSEMKSLWQQQGMHPHKHKAKV